MTSSFGPQLIGEAEKTLNALLRRFLEGRKLSEPQWVTLRLDCQLGDNATTDALIAAVADRAHFSDAERLVAELTTRGLLEDGRLTRAGRELAAAMQATIAEETAPIWDDLPAEDVAAATRVLNEVVTRARAVLRQQ